MRWGARGTARHRYQGGGIVERRDDAYQNASHGRQIPAYTHFAFATELGHRSGVR